MMLFSLYLNAYTTSFRMVEMLSATVKHEKLPHGVLRPPRGRRSKVAGKLTSLVLATGQFASTPGASLPILSCNIPYELPGLWN